MYEGFGCAIFEERDERYCISSFSSSVYPGESIPRKLVHSTLFQLFVFQIEVDELVIPRTVLVVFLCIFALIAFVFLALHWMEPIYSPALTSRKNYTF